VESSNEFELILSIQGEMLSKQLLCSNLDDPS